jgi:mono/diheme cytochrome c family protein
VYRVLVSFRPWSRFAYLAPVVIAFAAWSFAPAAGQQKLPADHAEKMAKGTDLFKNQVRGILSTRCVNCHGGAKTHGDLDMTTREGLLSGGDEAVVVPFDHKKSKLYRLITHADKPYMPHKADKLSDKEIALIAQWIDLGAPYDRPLLDKVAGKKPMVVTDKDRQFWSFLPLKVVPPPKVNNTTWCRTPVDHFILAKLEEKGLTPGPQLDRLKLIRRVTFDLIGLPPTPQETDAFLKDTSPDAYEKLIDRLLDSPHFGEKWARHWLDLARFAESSGYEHDYDRPFAYHYRDFVIKAFNTDLPYNTFVKWQIAGDEYEPDNPLAMMATGFLAAGTHSTQTTKNLVEKERYEQLDDKLRTLGTSMLGLTIGCARCHDHKYDPIPTRDYYRMLATFTTTVKSNIDINLDPAGHKKALAAWQAEHDQLLQPLRDFEKNEMPGRFELWLKSQPVPAPVPTWVVLDLQAPKATGGAIFTPQDDGSLLTGGKIADFDTYTFTARTSLKGITALRLETLADDSLPRKGPGHADNGNFALSDFRVTATTRDGKTMPLKLVNPRATFQQKGLPVAAAIDNDKKSAWAVDPEIGHDHAAVFDLDTPLDHDGEVLLTMTLEFKNNKKHAIGRPRLSVTTRPRPVSLDGESTPEHVLKTLDLRAGGPLTDDNRARLLKWYRTLDRQWQRLVADVAAHQKATPRPPTVKALIASEGVPPLRMHTQGADFFEQTYFLKRGDTDQKDGVATQGFLQVLTRHPDGEKHWQTPPPAGWHTSYRRRALAEWITDVDHGAGHLLARVIVNRLWQHHLGRGIVGTPSDFGFQGEPPSHPELLDYLANELIKNGWRLKPIHKLIMTSAVYMQSSEVNAKNVKYDPENRYFWYRPRQRLEAELIRDALLSVSGTLDTRQYGPGTLDPNHKRRSIYFFIKRSKLVPALVLFDAPDALGGMDRRPSTTVAPQALWLMNNEVVRGYADAFAKRIDANDRTPLEEVVQSAYRIALGRAPQAAELKVALQFLQEQAASYTQAGRPNARQLALGDFCQVILSLNEFVYID